MNHQLHRKCACNGSCDKCREDELRRWSAPRGVEPAHVPQIVHDVLRSPGQPLDGAMRMEMEPRFGHDFSRVRVHADERAAQSASAVGALAYAAGQHIVLGERSLPREVIAHELAPVAQHRGGDVVPQNVAAADSPAELEADRAAASALSVSESHDGALHRYRSKKAFNFGKADTGSLVEQEFTDKKTQPWIETIDIAFDGTTVDANGETIPTGTLTATYHANSAALSPIVVSVAGGTPTLGLTDITKNNKVDRIEGVGYNDKPLGKTLGEGPGTKYAKPDPGTGDRMASMHFAIFFKGGQAIHGGMLNVGSHACVHVAPANMIQMNYHSVVGLTKVSTSYTASSLSGVCCERIKNKGFKKKGQAAHPCEKTDPATCP